MQYDFRRALSDRVIDALKNKSAPWQLPSDGLDTLSPFNPVNGVVFRGGNAVALGMKGYHDPRWCTEQQAQKYGWNVRANEVPTTVEFWKFDYEVEDRDPATGEMTKRRVPLERPIAMYAQVFNLSQMANVPSLDVGRDVRSVEGIAIAQRILDNSPVAIVVGQRDRAQYSATEDKVFLPHADNADRTFYARAFRMLAHASGHPRRLNRHNGQFREAGEHAMDELRVDLAQLVLARRLGLPYEPKVHDVYVDAWCEALSADKNELFRAARDAEQISEYLLSFGWERSRDSLQEDKRSPTVLTDAQREFLLRQRTDSTKVRMDDAARAWEEVMKPLLAKGLVEPDLLAGGYRLTGAGLRARAVVQSELPQPGPAPMHRSEPDREGRIYLNVPKNEHADVRRLGAAVWDKERRSWFLPRGTDESRFAKWLDMPNALSENDIRSQFARALEDAGLVVDALPAMDGKWYYTTVSTSRNKKALKGSYVGTIKGNLAHGYICNFDTGVNRSWEVEGVVLSEEERRQFQQQIEANKRVRMEEVEAGYVKVAAQSDRRWARMKEAAKHPYLERKQVDAFGLRVEGSSLVTPVQDINGKIWSLHYIPSGDGQTKLFSKGGKKTGNFHVLGDPDTADTILFGEGYATSASLHMGSALPVVETFDSGNINAVVSAFRAKYPGKEFIICGDDDFPTSEKILETVNRSITSDFAQKKLGLNVSPLSEVEIDGVKRPVPGDENCSLRLEWQVGKEGVKRVVGEIRNENTNSRLPLLINNVGREKALAAATEHGAKAVFPQFESSPSHLSDFNDLHVKEGLHRVTEQLSAVVERSMVQPLAPRSREESHANYVQPREGQQYTGTILRIEGGRAYQDMGKGKLVRHDMAKLGNDVRAGTVVRVNYTGGKAIVSDASKSIDGLGR